jgi:hypothetical protein
MPIIVKPISATLVKDADGFGKAVLSYLICIGPLLYNLDRARKTEDSNL